MSLAAVRRTFTPVLSLLLLGGVLAGCGGEKLVFRDFCEAGVVQRTDGCVTDEQCRECADKVDGQDPTNWYCRISPTGNQASNYCYQDFRECTPSQFGDVECCPGQACTDIQGAGICSDKAVACDPASPSACDVKGQYCEPLLGSVGPSYEQKPGCTFRACMSTADCDDGLSCFNNFCVGEPPCGGGCAPGSVCTPVNNQCYRVTDAEGQPVPEYTYGGKKIALDGSCQQTCNVGSMLVFADGLNTFSDCDPTAKQCVCAALPDITSTDTARFSSAAIAGDQLLVSAYDGTYGDLVLHTFTKGSDGASPQRVKTEWIDGVPTTGEIVGNPNGPRGGRAEAGVDVGQYTSIAYDASSGTTHIAYYAAAGGDLKYARRTGTGEWIILTVDGSDNGDVGLYTSLALAPDGAPVIAYFQKSGVATTELQTAVKVARAKSATPSSASDWTLSTLDTGARTPPPCNASCQSDELCADVLGAPNGQCVKKAVAASNCAPACGSGEFCGLNGAQPVCYPSLTASTVASLPDGNGLFPSIAYYDAKPIVVWYDHTNGQLKGVIASADSPGQGAAFKPADVTVLDDGTVGTQTHDVGRFTSLAIGPQALTNRIAVSYMDATSRQLRVLTAGAGWASLTPPENRIVDTGAGEPGGDPLLFVGADTSVRFHGQNVNLVYQDATGGDLRLATQDSPGAAITYKQTLARDGAGGFYAKLLIDGSTRFATHAIIKARPGNGAAVESANRLEVLRIP